ncbi:hypothetical protein PAL_GLEAN10002960 [Pteropus alecto]|uniref:Uncharacterized protein n=1 Tax=Pteropus alecto TaxID=9402 RepID=L5JZB8_PTEAL|nr:hypothetical protein PAL_GLEAN10002960 [Pteropus alecto]
MSGPLRVCVGQKEIESLAGGRVQVTRGAGLGPEFHDRPPGATTYPGAYLGTCGAAGTTRDETLEALSGTVGRLGARSSHTTSHSVPSAVTMHTACVAASAPQEPKSPVKAACAPAHPRAIGELAVMQSAKTIRPHTGHTTERHTRTTGILTRRYNAQQREAEGSPHARTPPSPPSAADTGRTWPLTLKAKRSASHASALSKQPTVAAGGTCRSAESSVTQRPLVRSAVRVTTLAGWAESRALGRKDRMEAGAVAPVTGADRMAQPLPMETETGQEVKMGHKTETG